MAKVVKINKIANYMIKIESQYSKIMFKQMRHGNLKSLFWYKYDVLITDESLDTLCKIGSLKYLYLNSLKFNVLNIPYNCRNNISFLRLQNVRKMKVVRLYVFHGRNFSTSSTLYHLSLKVDINCSKLQLERMKPFSSTSRLEALYLHAMTLSKCANTQFFFNGRSKQLQHVRIHNWWFNDTLRKKCFQMHLV